MITLFTIAGQLSSYLRWHGRKSSVIYGESFDDAQARRSRPSLNRRPNGITTEEVALPIRLCGKRQ